MFKDLKTLIFAGGGVRGLAYVGALQVLRDELGIDFGARNPALENVVGVSIGTMFAAMIAIGFNVAEITDFASAMKQSDVISTDPMRIFGGELSIDDGLKLRERVKMIFDKKKISAEITFSELFKITKISFRLAVTDITNATVVHVDEKSHPDFSVLSAMVASMTIPLIYPPVVSPDGHLWIDGGLLENYPITRYDPETSLGFDFKTNVLCKADNLINYISRVLYVVQVPLDVVSWNLMSPEHQKKSVIIDTGDICTLKNFSDLSVEIRNKLLYAGKIAMLSKISDLNNPTCNKSEYNSVVEGLPTFLNALKTCEPKPIAYI